MVVYAGSGGVPDGVADDGRSSDASADSFPARRPSLNVITATAIGVNAVPTAAIQFGVNEFERDGSPLWAGSSLRTTVNVDPPTGRGIATLGGGPPAAVGVGLDGEVGLGGSEVASESDGDGAGAADDMGRLRVESKNTSSEIKTPAIAAAAAATFREGTTLCVRPVTGMSAAFHRFVVCSLGGALPVRILVAISPDTASPLRRVRDSSPRPSQTVARAGC